MSFHVFNAVVWFAASAGLFASVARMFINDKRRNRQQQSAR